MKHLLSREESQFWEEAKGFAREAIAPEAAEWERRRAVSREALRAVAARGYFGATIPEAFGGRGWSYARFGLLVEAVSRFSPSLAALINVQAMVAETILRWGSESMKERLLPSLARYERSAALALTEPGAGSDLLNLRMSFRRAGSDWVVDGVKKWITNGARAEVALAFGRCGEDSCVALLEIAERRGVAARPVMDMSGFRAAQLADLEFSDFRCGGEAMLSPRMGAQLLAPYALLYGRLAVAWSALGILRACVEEAARRMSERRASGVLLAEQPMLQTLLAEMGLDWEAACGLCVAASRSLDARADDAAHRAIAAKHFAARAAARHSTQAVQIIGAAGYLESTVAARCMRDSKVLEIIEGSNQIMQGLLSRTYLSRGAAATAGALEKEVSCG